MIQFKHPELLWLLLTLPFLAFMLGKPGKWAAMLFPSTGIASALGKNLQKNPLRLLLNLRLLSMALLIIALARPQQGSTQAQTNASGIDIILALDISTSMNALDFT
jgi:Ca-activated chloride channel family protein